jgi:hypothetical protein
MFPCVECERRRREMTLMLEATKQWTMKPWGPNVHDVYMKLRNEAYARGDFDDLVRPNT